MERGTDSLSVSTSSYTILHQYRLIWRDIRSLSLRIFMYSLFIVHLISILKTRILYKEKEPRKRKVEDRVIRTPNLLIWNQTRYRCAMPSFQLTSFLSAFKTWNGLSVTLKLRIPTLDTTEYHKQFKSPIQLSHSSCDNSSLYLFCRRECRSFSFFNDSFAIFILKANTIHHNHSSTSLSCSWRASLEKQRKLIRLISVSRCNCCKRDNRFFCRVI